MAGVLILLALLDRAGAPAARAVTPGPEQAATAAPADAISSSFFCAGATEGGLLGATGNVVVADAGTSPATARITLLDSSGLTASETLRVGAHSSATAHESFADDGGWAGATVQVDAGAVAVEQVIDSPLGRTEQPCPSSGSPQWYFPSGTTRVNADEAILLLNPYPADTIVDLSFATEEGDEAPIAFQGVTVPAKGLVALDVGSRLRRRASIAVTVRAREGNVVAWRTAWVLPPPAGAPIVGTPSALQPLADPALPVAGIVSEAGAPAASIAWAWPDGGAAPGIDEEFHVYNPSTSTAQVRLGVGLAQGSAEPFTFSVAPGQDVPVISGQEARIPAGVPYDAVLTSLNGVAVVASRTISDSGTGGSGRTGTGSLIGALAASPAWIIPAPELDAQHRGTLVLSNPGPSAVRLEVAGVSTTLGPAGRAAIAVPAGISGPIVVRANGPIYAEYDLDGQGTTGSSLSFGVPLSGS